MKNIKEFTEEAVKNVKEGREYTTEIGTKETGGTQNVIQTPEDIANGKVKFYFYFKEGSEDEGAVYFDVKFKRGRKITKRTGYTLKSASGLLRELNAVGYILGEDNCEQFKNWIMAQIKQEDNFIKKHCNIGWDSIEMEDGKIEQEIRLQDIHTKDGKLGSEYCGELVGKVGKRGTVESYVKGIKEHVIGIPKLEAALVTGFAGFITQALENEKKQGCNIVLNYTGKTSKGKTTTSKLALTPFGNPQDLIRNFNETQAKSEIAMVSYGIIPYIMDDKIAGYDVNRKADKNKLIAEIMALSHGEVKGRFTDKEEKRYCCPVIMSTEKSIADAISGTSKEGSYHRFIEIECKNDLTKSGKHAEALDEFMEANYGEAGEAFAKYLIERYDTDTLARDYGDVLKDVQIKDGIDHRAAKRMSVFIFTAQLVNECFDLNIDTDRLLEMLNQQVNVAFGKSNKLLAELKKLRDYVTANAGYFETYKKFDRDTCLGVHDYDSTNTTKQLIIEPAALNHIVNGGTPEDYFKYINRTKDVAGNIKISSNKGRELTKAWKAYGHLTSGGKHGGGVKNTNGRNLGGKQRQVYIIDFSAV